MIVLRLDFETMTGYTYTATDADAGACTDKGNSPIGSLEYLEGKIKIDIFPIFL